MGVRSSARRGRPRETAHAWAPPARHTVSAMPTPPSAPRREHVREHHGDTVVDPYEWLRDKSDPKVIAHLEAENAYAEEMTAHLEPLRQALSSYTSVCTSAASIPR